MTSPVDLAHRLARVADRVALSLAEFPDDPNACAEWVEELGSAELALDKALGLLDQDERADQLEGRLAGALAVIVQDADGRWLYAVRPDGSVEIPNDLTLEEVRSVLEQLGPALATRAMLAQ